VVDLQQACNRWPAVWPTPCLKLPAQVFLGLTSSLRQVARLRAYTCISYRRLATTLNRLCDEFSLSYLGYLPLSRTAALEISNNKLSRECQIHPCALICIYNQTASFPALHGLCQVCENDVGYRERECDNARKCSFPIGIGRLAAACLHVSARVGSENRPFCD